MATKTTKKTKKTTLKTRGRTKGGNATFAFGTTRSKTSTRGR